jgi:hypothetical protein
LSVAPSSARVFDDLDELVHAEALATGEGDEFSGTLDDNTTFGRSSNRNATPASELEQPFVAQHPKRPQHGVRVDAEYCGEILRGRQTLTWLCLAFRDRATNLSGDLLVEIGGIALVYLDIEHGAIHSSAIVSGVQA